MALPIRNTKTTEIAGLDTFYNGGKGSGNFGHSGRPGEIGGSGSGKGGGKIDKEATKKLREELERLGDSFRESPGMKVLIEKDKTGEVKDSAYYASKTAKAKAEYEKAEDVIDDLTDKLAADEKQIAEYKKGGNDPHIVRAIQERIEDLSKEIDLAKEKRDKLYDAYEDAMKLEKQHKDEQDAASTFWR